MTPAHPTPSLPTVPFSLSVVIHSLLSHTPPTRQNLQRAR